MTTPRIEEMVEEFEKKWNASGLNDVEEYCSCPPFSGKKCKCISREQKFVDWLRTALTEAHQAGIDEAVEKIVDKISRNSFLVDGTMMTPTEVILKALKDNK